MRRIYSTPSQGILRCALRACGYLLPALAILLLPGLAWAAEGAQLPSYETIHVERSHSRLVELPEGIQRISVGDDAVADVLIITPKLIYVNGIAVGSTNITVWSKKDKIISRINVQVGRDITRLKQNLAEILPDEPIEVRELEGGVVLSGQVSSEAVKAKAESVARVFEEKRISNLIDVADQKQVKLELTFAEVSLNALKRMNINLGYLDLVSGNMFYTFLSGLTGPPEISFNDDGSVTIEQFKSNQLGGWASYISDSGKMYQTFIDILKENGNARLLAKPNLVCLSGQKANFLAGGEFPIPVPGKDFAAIIFKKYGVQLNFKPDVLADGRIRLEVEPEVSELDWSVATVTGGFNVPGLTTRKTKTILELRDGEEFAIAGLLKTDVRKSIAKWPFLGDIPILGILFRSSSFIRAETDLLIVVKPRIVKASEPSNTTLPDTNRSVPGDVTFFLLGYVDNIWGGAKKEDQAGTPPDHLMQMEGKFGHEVTY